MKKNVQKLGTCKSFLLIVHVKTLFYFCSAGPVGLLLLDHLIPGGGNTEECWANNQVMVSNLAGLVFQ